MASRSVNLSQPKGWGKKQSWQAIMAEIEKAITQLFVGSYMQATMTLRLFLPKCPEKVRLWHDNWLEWNPLCIRRDFLDGQMIVMEGGLANEVPERWGEEFLWWSSEVLPTARRSSSVELWTSESEGSQEDDCLANDDRLTLGGLIRVRTEAPPQVTRCDERPSQDDAGGSPSR